MNDVTYTVHAVPGSSPELNAHLATAMRETLGVDDAALLRAARKLRKKAEIEAHNARFTASKKSPLSNTRMCGAIAAVYGYEPRFRATRLPIVG